MAEAHEENRATGGPLHTDRTEPALGNGPIHDRLSTSAWRGFYSSSRVRGAPRAAELPRRGCRAGTEPSEITAAPAAGTLADQGAKLTSRHWISKRTTRSSWTSADPASQRTAPSSRPFTAASSMSFYRILVG